MADATPHAREHTLALFAALSLGLVRARTTAGARAELAPRHAEREAMDARRARRLGQERPSRASCRQSRAPVCLHPGPAVRLSRRAKRRLKKMDARACAPLARAELEMLKGAP
jgi:hypothetical protein